MIVSHLRFFLVAERNTAGGYFIPALQTNVPELSGHERLCVATSDGYIPDPTLGIVNPNTLYIRSLNQVRRCFRIQLLSTYALSVASWIALIMTSWSTATAYFEEGMVWYRFLPVAVFAFLSALYSVQAVRPIAHDNAGAWVNLRTGSTNMHNGSRIQKERKHK